MSIDAEDFLVFETYRNAVDHAFSNNLVSQDDKDSYNNIFEHLRDAVAGSISRSGAPEELDDWTCKFGHKGGVQGHRPKDLWASIINRDSEAFSKFPQIYVIASETGVEIGFSVTIHEDDYHNTEVKRKNRSIIPIINAKLPEPTSSLVQKIQQILSTESGWIYAEKARQGASPSFDNLPEVIGYLKSAKSTAKGGGAIYKILDFEEVAESEKRLENELVHALSLFRPIMQMLKPSIDQAQYARNLIELAELAEEVPAFDPDSDDDGKMKVLKEIAVRQGQAKFRDALFEAYDGCCVISGCTLAPALQAAHISPWNGKKSNQVSNGILLRADIHTLFDLGLLRIDPDTRAVLVVPSLIGSEYEDYAGRTIIEPNKPSQRPSKAALARKLELFPAE